MHSTIYHRVVILFTLFIMGCGIQAPADPVPSVTPFPSPLPSPTLQPTSTIVPEPSVVPAPPEVDTAREALEAGDYEQAVIILTPLAHDYPAAGELLADVHHRWGMKLINDVSDPVNEPEPIREGLDHLIQGLLSAPDASPIKQELTLDRDAAQGFLEALDALELLGRLKEQKADLAERKQQILLTLDIMKQVVKARPDFPGIKAIYNDTLVEAGQIYEELGKAERQVEAKKTQWQEGLVLCEQARDLWSKDAAEGKAARECVGRLDRLINPPPPTPTSQRPTPPPSKSFAVTLRNSFEGSGDSGQFESCIDIKVLDRAGNPVSGAVIGINNGRGQSFQNTTDGSGYTGRCGLGASTWTVVVFWAGVDVKGAATTVYVNGSPGQRAGINFRER